MQIQFQPARSLDINHIPLEWNAIRGVYVIYSTQRAFRYPTGLNDIAYIGSGWIGKRLFSHARGDGNAELFSLLQEHGRGQGWLRCVWAETDDELGARTAEAILLRHFNREYGSVPYCNKILEAVPSRVRVTWNKDVIAERHQEELRREAQR